MSKIVPYIAESLGITKPLYRLLYSTKQVFPSKAYSTRSNTVLTRSLINLLIPVLYKIVYR
ncbi:hypothetical protein [Shigella phage ESh19]|nr:hypothetical protein [Shigella phage ESh19]